MSPLFPVSPPPVVPSLLQLIANNNIKDSKAINNLNDKRLVKEIVVVVLFCFVLFCFVLFCFVHENLPR
ncbi:hypothetical protein EPJ64_08130 [Brachyspira aalborgi]|uniref:hypothetical protein n=1 Tax=Brachyspira aalborgi TaxID=29522 RepID=UPI0011CA8AA0|nr:hypothetical protein [Brachyspira aalborgi]TXJ17891.1 hypothetical protein EPJ64_08130 [Brachyspira aalborgi]TXJ48002.1 hypothetical protein EPJ75_09605 [Brachyspira aalborgi]